MFRESAPTITPAAEPVEAPKGKGKRGKKDKKGKKTKGGDRDINDPPVVEVTTQLSRYVRYVPSSSND